MILNNFTQYMPFDFEAEMNITSRYNPKAKMRNNKAFRFWKRALIQRAMSVIDADLPDTWEGPIRDNFYYALFIIGFVAIYNDSKYGYIWQPASLSEQGVFYQPTKALIANPLFKTPVEKEIGKDCGILKLTPDYFGILDIVNYYAEKLASADKSINTSLMNAWGSKIAIATNKAAAETIKKVYDKMQDGENLVVTKDKPIIEDDTRSGKEAWNILDLQYSKDEYITDSLLADFQTILNNFDSEIGIPTLPYQQKKERMVTDEATMKTHDAIARSLTWIKTLDSCTKEIKRIFPDITLDFALHYDQSEENAPINDSGVNGNV